MEMRYIAIGIGATLAVGTTITMTASLVLWRSARTVASYVNAEPGVVHTRVFDEEVMRAMILQDATPERRDRMLRWLDASESAEVRAWAENERAALQIRPVEPPVEHIAIIAEQPASVIVTRIDTFEVSATAETLPDFETSDPIEEGPPTFETSEGVALPSSDGPVETFADTSMDSKTRDVNLDAAGINAAMMGVTEVAEAVPELPEAVVAEIKAKVEPMAKSPEPVEPTPSTVPAPETPTEPIEPEPVEPVQPETPAFGSLPAAIATREVPIPLIATEELDVWSDKGVEQAEKVLATRTKELHGCYAMALLYNPTIGGLLDIQWNVVNGRVSAISVPINTTGSDRVGACIAGRVQRWRFPATVKGDITWTLYLRPGDPNERRKKRSALAD